MSISKWNEVARGGAYAFLALLTAAVLCGRALAQAQLARIDGTATAAQLSAVAGVGDVDRDGFEDYAVSAPFDDAHGSDSGTVWIYSGRMGVVIATWAGGPDDTFGFTVVNVGDPDGDGHDDIAVGAPAYSSTTDLETVTVYSGRYLFDQSGSEVLFHIDGGSTSDLFGYSVAKLGDVNNDGHDDFAVGAYRWSQQRGQVLVYSGVDGAVLWTLSASTPNNYFGHSICGIGDANNDGHADIVVGAFGEDGNGLTDSGVVRVYSGMTGNLLYSAINGDASNDWFGTMVAAAGDLDADGVDDFIASASGQANAGSTAGYAQVYSGFSGVAIASLRFDGKSPGDYFGRFLDAGRDLNSDGYPDMVVSAIHEDTGGIDRGRIYSYSGHPASLGQEIFNLAGKDAGDSFGHSVSFLDANGDGFSDFVTTAPNADPGGVSNAGSAYLFSGTNCQASWANYGSGCSGTNGIPGLTLSADPVLGESFDLDVDNSLGVATKAFMIIGTQRAVIPFQGCELLVQPPWTILPLAIPASGLSLPVAIHDTALCGVVINLQILMVDPGAPAGFSFTPGLELTPGG